MDKIILEKFEPCPLDKKENRKEIKNLILKNAGNEDFYVLHYDVKTSEYLNEISFKNFEEALLEFNKAQSFYCNDRIELIYSSNSSLGKQDYIDVVIATKMR